MVMRGVRIRPLLLIGHNIFELVGNCVEALTSGEGRKGRDM